MTSNSVSLPRTLVNHILTHVQQAPNQEVCGLIGRVGTESTSLYPVANMAKDNEKLFQMEPKQQIDAMRQMRERGEELFAIYHSHPHASGMPSSIDLAQASYPDALYLIISLNTIGVLEMRGFYIRNADAEEVSLQVYDAG